MAHELSWKDIVKKEFNPPSLGGAGYDEIAVDDFLDEVVTQVQAGTLSAAAVQGQTFPKARFGRRGYSVTEVDEFLDQIATQFGGAPPSRDNSSAAQSNAGVGGGTSSWGGASSASGESPYVERTGFFARLFGKG